MSMTAEQIAAYQALADKCWEDQLTHAYAEGRKDQLEECQAQIAELQRDADRYRWLRDEAFYADEIDESGQMIWCVIGKNAGDCHPIDGEELSESIDEEMKP